MSMKQQLSRLTFSVTAATLLTSTLLASPVMASEKIRWQVPLAFPSHLVGLTTPVKHLSESLKTISGGYIQLRYYEPGELVPPFEIMNAVSTGKYPAGYTWVGYDQGTIPALPLYSGAPFNMEPPAHLAWYYQGDGKKLLEEIYAQRNIHPMLCSIIGPEGAGWFAKPIEKLGDIDGLRIRFAGIGGKVLEKLGASVTMVPGGEIYLAGGSAGGAGQRVQSLHSLARLHCAGGTVLAPVRRRRDAVPRLRGGARRPRARRRAA